MRQFAVHQYVTNTNIQQQICRMDQRGRDENLWVKIYFLWSVNYAEIVVDVVLEEPCRLLNHHEYWKVEYTQCFRNQEGPRCLYNWIETIFVYTSM